MPTFLQVADVAGLIGRVRGTVYYHLARGNVAPAAYTARGAPLFTHETVAVLRRLLAGERRGRKR